MKIEMAPSVVLENLEDLYFELVPKDVDLRKKRLTYLSKEKKKTSNLLGIETIKTALADIDTSNLKNIFLIGSEPIFNPDFNRILRHCLKVATTTVITGAQNINEKKARFMAKVQSEFDDNYSLNFNIILYHYDERINDNYCNRGDFRKVMHAIKSLQKYDFMPKVIVKNHSNTPENELIEGFKKVFKQFDVEIGEIVINSSVSKELDIHKLNFMTFARHLHCAKSRVFASSGVFSCPNLVGDNRARVGATLKDFSKRNYLETEMCNNCIFKELNN